MEGCGGSEGVGGRSGVRGFIRKSLSLEKVDGVSIVLCMRVLRFKGSRRSENSSFSVFFRKTVGVPVCF